MVSRGLFLTYHVKDLRPLRLLDQFAAVRPIVIRYDTSRVQADSAQSYKRPKMGPRYNCYLTKPATSNSLFTVNAGWLDFELRDKNSLLNIRAGGHRATKLESRGPCRTGEKR